MVSDESNFINNVITMDMFILQVYPTLLDKQTGFQFSSTSARNQTKLHLGKESANITSLYFNGHNLAGNWDASLNV